VAKHKFVDKHPSPGKETHVFVPSTNCFIVSRVVMKVTFDAASGMKSDPTAEN
jgi:hypothetical protein